jgi:hypothetical protein
LPHVTAFTPTFSGGFFSARRAPSSASSICGAADAAKARKGVLKGPILEDAEFWITHVYDSRILREDTPKPDQAVEELPGHNVDGKPVAGTLFLQGLNLALDPRKDSVKKIFRGLYVATLSIKLR